MTGFLNPPTTIDFYLERNLAEKATDYYFWFASMILIGVFEDRVLNSYLEIDVFVD